MIIYVLLIFLGLLKVVVLEVIVLNFRSYIVGLIFGIIFFLKFNIIYIRVVNGWNGLFEKVEL